jgi:RNA polymerase sigma-70 factor (ECF subfamily)
VREPEPETIGRARAGDLRAFESIVRAYQADVWRFAYHLTHDRATADDVTQEAFLRAFRSLRSYRGEAKFTSWLMRIVRNCAVDSYRRSRREAPAIDPEIAGAEADRGDAEGSRPGSIAGSFEERTRIHEAIRRLPMELREPFVVIEVLGYNYQEASSILRVKVGTVKSRMHRARAALVSALSEDAVGEV